MLGLHCNWSGVPLDTGLAQRFAASLAVGLQEDVLLHQSDGVIFASRSSDRFNRRTWSPSTSPRGDRLLFMGHIDNRAELASNLNTRFDRHCDDATLYGICHAEWGNRCDLKIVGQYAAISCSADNQRIRLVRSPIAAPPLHFWKNDHHFIVASTARAIFATGLVRQELDQQKIADSLLLNYREGDRGWFSGISRLPVGTEIIVQRDSISRTGYYDPFASGPIKLANDQDYVDAANSLFKEATRASLKGFSRPAVSLSGGYDSQAVAANLLQILPKQQTLLGLTSIPEPDWDNRTRQNRFGDESEHVRALSRMYPDLEVEFVDAAGLSFDHKLESMFLMSGTAPRNAMNLYWMHEIHSRTKAANCDVLFTGAMGNATFSFDGTGALLNWLTNRNWKKLLREVWACRSDHKSFAHAFARHVVIPSLPDIIASRLSGGSDPDYSAIFETWCPLNREWAMENGLFERAADMGFDPSFSAKMSTKERRLAITGNAANEMGDLKLAMEVIGGIPSRDPTSYRPLVEFCFNIPDDQYLRNGQKRWLAKRMLNGSVPDAVLNETRRGLQAADSHLRIGRQLKQLQIEIDQLADDPSMSAMLNLPRLKKLLEDWPTTTPTNSDDPMFRAPLAISRALTTARFIRFVEGTNR